MSITRATILAATIVWAVAECVRLLRPDLWKLARALWTCGAALAAAHAAAALHLTYQWSHAAALEATRRQTLATTGLDWGGGLYVNYAFLALWLWDAGAWWRQPGRRASRPRLYANGLFLFFLFMFVNGAVVFAHGPGRAVGVAAVASVAIAWGVARARSSAA